MRENTIAHLFTRSNRNRKARHTPQGIPFGRLSRSRAEGAARAFRPAARTYIDSSCPGPRARTARARAGGRARVARVTICT